MQEPKTLLLSATQPSAGGTARACYGALTLQLSSDANHTSGRSLRREGLNAPLVTQTHCLGLEAAGRLLRGVPVAGNFHDHHRMRRNRIATLPQASR